MFSEGMEHYPDRPKETRLGFIMALEKRKLDTTEGTGD